MRKDIKEKTIINNNKEQEDILCERIKNTTSNWLENAIRNKNIHEVQVETLGLIIDELVDYIGNEKVANTVFDRINNLSL